MNFGRMRGNLPDTPGAARMGRGVVFALIVSVLPAVCAAAQSQPVTVADMIERDIAVADGHVRSGENRFQATGLLKQIYSDRHDLPGWVANGMPRPTALAMLETIRLSRTSGLRPRDYHLSALKQLMAASHAPLTKERRARVLARLELLLSDAFLRLAIDEAQGRLNPKTLRPSKPKPALETELQGALQKVFAGSLPGPVIESFAPQDPDYLGMRAALAGYRHLAASGEPPLIAAGPALREGDSGPRVKALIRRLQSAGDMPAIQVPTAFGPEVATALRRYQVRHGLRADAVAGRATIAMINRPAAHWVDTLRVNMERRRELPATLPSTRLIVNIADFSVMFFAGDKQRLSEKVIVGKSYQKTPEIISRIEYLVVNPSWRVPESIARKEILPAVRNDPNYFSRHDYQVLQGWGDNEKRIDPKSVKWKSLSVTRLPYHFREPSGPGNPLGRVKFMFANLHDVYMHDTPERGLFDAAQRTFSHGCIRVNHALRLAAVMLREDGHPDPGLLLIRAASEGSNRRIELNRPIPIYIVYMTAWAKDLNTIEFRPDVYGRDKRMLAALDAAPPPLSE